MSDPVTIHLLSTRSLPAELIGHAAAHGIIIDDLPFITIKPVEDEGLALRVRELAEEGIVAVFTSRNAVGAVAGWLKNRDGKGVHRLMGTIPAGEDWRIYCTGFATRREAEQLFGAGLIAGSAESAKSLAEVIRLKESPGDLWYFCGDHRRNELPDAMRLAGFSVNEAVVYRMMPTPHKVERTYDGIAFFSPSAAESYFSVNTAAPGARVFAIGRTTAEAVRTFCDNLIITADRPEEEVLIYQMISYYSQL